ncbi:hypothetical protein ACFPPD_20800 [Cohnella suwonensis]|uniref:Uncharacterized protein n=1 Tax=Cohnella suwonensis TaxID=696072 RepID=A0ABW0M1X0_9BACL
MAYIVYQDPKYGFSVKLPLWWKNYIVFERTTRVIDAKYGVFFLFKYKGKVYEEALSILVFRKTLKQWIKEGYDESPFVRLAARDGFIYAYALPGELPDEFLKKDKSDYDYKKYGIPIRLLKRMVNVDAPRIVKTFRLK